MPFSLCLRLHPTSTDNVSVPLSLRPLGAALLILVALAVPREARAQGVAVATLHVGARVARPCSIAANSSDLDFVTSVRVVCARSALRALRVSTGPDSAGDVIALVKAIGPQRLSGGEVTFTLISPLTTVASVAPILSRPRASVPTTVIVTMDF